MKRVLKPEEFVAITEAAQLTVLGGLINARRWATGEFKFQGGTSLRLVYGSPRFSEDLDFVLANTRGLTRIVNGAAVYVRSTLAAQYPDIAVNVKARDENAETTGAKNPSTFMLTLSSPEWMQTIKIKLEFWSANQDSVKSYQSAPLTASIPGRSPIGVAVTPVITETAVLDEILVDKLHALGDRNYTKWRDVFDLWWLSSAKGYDAARAAAEFERRFAYHAAMYPPEKPFQSAIEALTIACDKIDALLASPEGLLSARKDMERWLSADSPLRLQIRQILAGGLTFVKEVITHLGHGREDLMPQSPANPVVAGKS